MAYGYLGTMRTQPGLRDEVVAALVEGADALTTAGCRLYVVSIDEVDSDRIWVNEVWGSKEQHDASLSLPEVKAGIAAVDAQADRRVHQPGAARRRRPGCRGLIDRVTDRPARGAGRAPRRRCR